MHTKQRQLSRALASAAAAAILLLGVSACGSDDEASEDTAAAASSDPQTSEAPDTTQAAATTEAAATTDSADTTEPAVTAEAAADVDAFCQAELAAEAAANSEDPSAAGPAFEALVAAAPPEIADSVQAVIDHAQDGPGSPEFDAPYGEMIVFMQTNCGFNDLALTASEYAFGGLPDEVPAGPVIVSLDNIGKEVHEIILFHVNEGVTETAEEILNLPEEESFTKGTVSGVAFGFPGTTAHTATELEPGRYIAVCFMPQGMTPEMMATMNGPDSTLPPGAGPPHFTLGMMQEFTVV